ncbi:MAG: hypothetical protein B6D63_03665 [Candidatus Latescibacteria bacterium 4484_7]|nr:MAG: hypothetical protein B6D63_03665 [Candidatus Latescibacteria bacterium 4484_7]
MKRIVLAITLVLALSIPSNLYAYSESFKGELKLVKRLTPKEQIYYFGLQYLLNKYQKRQYLSISDKREREEWIERFWAENDPTPTTPINERKMEHEKRVRLARRLFGMKKPPGWDKRGETLIRFGLPTARVRTWADISFYGMKPPGEIWYYKKLNMIIPFQNFNLKGEYIYAITPYGRSSRRELDRLQNVTDLLKNGVLQEVYPTEYMNFDEIKDLVDFNPEQIDYIADRDLKAETPTDMIARIEDEKKREAMNNFYKYMKEKPTIYSFELKHESMPLYFDVTSFRGGEAVLRTEINFEVPTKDIRFVERNGKLSGRVKLSALVRDIDMKPVASGTDEIEVTFDGKDVSKGPSLLPGKITLSLKPGYYRLGLEAQDENSDRFASYKTNIQLRPIEGDPYISDILFASSIKESESGEKFQKGNLNVVPHPIHAYRKGNPLSFYFEIYNLKTDEKGMSFYKVKYRINPITKRRKGPVLEEVPTTVSSSFETSGYGPTQFHHLSIATDNLWKGIFELVVTVTDRISFKTFEKRTRFSIVE